MCTWFATTLGLIIAVAFWRTEVFTGTFLGVVATGLPKIQVDLILLASQA